MKVIEKSEEKLVVETHNIYVADDGTEFDDQLECIRYENDKVLHKLSKIVEDFKAYFVGVPLNFDGYANEEEYEWYKINSPKEFEYLVEYYKAYTEDSCEQMKAPKTYPTIVAVNEEGWGEGPYCYSMEDFKETAETFFAEFGVKITFE